MRSVLKEELCLRNLGLGFHMPEAFCQAQWRWPSPVFVLYRTVMSGYSIYAFVDMAVAYANSPHNIMVFLTTWTYLVETAFFFVGLLLAVIHVCCPRLINPQSVTDRVGAEQMTLESKKTWAKNGSDSGGVHNAGYSGELSSATRKPEAQRASPVNLEAQLDESLAPPEMPWFVQCYWVLTNIIQVFPFIVTIIYFSALYDKAEGITRPDMNVHGMNSVMALADFVICARPVRLLHFVYPVVYGIVYVVFSIIYWSLDKQNNVLYENVLDWNKPGQTIGVILPLTVVGVPLIQLANFGIFKLRLYLFQRIYGDRYL